VFVSIVSRKGSSKQERLFPVRAVRPILYNPSILKETTIQKNEVMEEVYLFHLLSAISKMQVSTVLSVGGRVFLANSRRASFSAKKL